MNRGRSFRTGPWRGFFSAAGLLLGFFRPEPPNGSPSSAGFFSAAGFFSSAGFLLSAGRASRRFADGVKRGRPSSPAALPQASSGWSNRLSPPRLLLGGRSSSPAGACLGRGKRIVGVGSPAAAARPRAAGGVRLRRRLFAQHPLLLAFHRFVARLADFLELFEGGHAGVDAIVLQFEACRALHALQRLADVVESVDVPALQVGALAEVDRRVLRAAESQVGQPAEIEDARVFRAAFDRRRQPLVCLLRVAGKIGVNAAAIFWRQHGVLSEQRNGRQRCQSSDQQDDTTKHDSKLLPRRCGFALGTDRDPRNTGPRYPRW